MPHFVYIIYSPSIKKFYVGETVDPEVRIGQHNSRYFTKSSTRIVRDWELKKMIQLVDIIAARKIEKYIKSMKSKRFLTSLIESPEFYNKFKKIVFDKFSIVVID